MSDGSFWLGFLIGAIAVSFLFAVVLSFMLKGKRPDSKIAARVQRTGLALLMVFMVGAALAFGQVHATFAQSTPVPLEIPTDVIFSETNNWMSTFAPIAAIGIGISIALAILGYLGNMIKKAFN